MGNIIRCPGKKSDKKKAHHEESLIDQKINEMIDRYLKNELINNKYIPDVIERKIYENITKMVFGLLKDTLEHTNVEIMGHILTFKIEPKDDCVSNEKKIDLRELQHEHITS